MYISLVKIGVHFCRVWEEDSDEFSPQSTGRHCTGSIIKDFFEEQIAPPSHLEKVYAAGDHKLKQLCGDTRLDAVFLQPYPALLLPWGFYLFLLGFQNEIRKVV